MPLDLVQTRDGSWTSYNPDVGEHYHNLSGALSEAQNIYIAPFQLEERLARKQHLTVLDPFLGLGYNTLACLDAFIRLKQSQFMDARLTVIAFESDPEILALIPAVLNNLDRNDLKIFSAAFEHKIYYRTQHDLSDLLESGKLDPDPGIVLKIVVGDTRQMVQALPADTFDLIYHDAFSTRKQPELWTKQLLMQYSRILTPEDGTVLTYSSAAPFRSAFAEAGFNIARIDFPNGKNGTMAYTGTRENPAPLSPVELALMQCKSGIPYEDNDTLSLTREDILAAHERRKAQSDRPTSSSVHRTYGYFKK